MDISSNRRTYIRELLQTNLGMAGIPLEEHGAFISSCLSVVKGMTEKPLKDKIFDVSACISSLSQRESITTDAAKERLLKNPALLFGKLAYEIGTIHARMPQDRFHSPRAKSNELILAPPHDDKDKNPEDVNADNSKRKGRKAPLALADIAEAARLTQQNDGRRPTAYSGPVLYGSIADGKLTWVAINSAFMEGTRGLSNSGYTSLANFLDGQGIAKSRSDNAKKTSPEEEISEKAPVRKRRSAEPTPEEKAELLRQSFKRYFEKESINPPPTENAKPLPKPDKPEEKAAQSPAIPAAPIEQAPVPAAEPLPIPRDDGKICAREIFAAIADYAIKGVVPKSGNKSHIIAGLPVSEASAALREGRAEGWKNFTPREDDPPSSVSFFGEAAGLFEREGGKLVPAPVPEIKKRLKEHGLS